MASLVKANRNLSSGGLSVLKSSYSISDGVLTYEIEYVCLPQFAGNHTSTFRKGATPVTPLPTSINGLAVDKQPQLNEFNYYTENGLTYFKVTYAGSSASDTSSSDTEGEWEIEESSDVKNVSWSYTKPVGYTRSVPGTINGDTEFVQTGTETYTASADYVSYTETASSTNAFLPLVKGSVGGLFNRRGSGLAGSPIATTVETTSSSVDSSGVKKYSASSTGIYISPE